MKNIITKIVFIFFRFLALFGYRDYQPDEIGYEFAQGHRRVHRTHCLYTLNFGPDWIAPYKNPSQWVDKIIKLWVPKSGPLFKSRVKKSYYWAHNKMKPKLGFI